MVIKVFRYLFPCMLDTNKKFTLDMPKNTEILCAKIKPYEMNASIWALVDDSQPMEKRTFLIMGTGRKFDFYCRFFYIDTIFEQRDDNPDDCWVWHIFEVR